MHALKRARTEQHGIAMIVVMVTLLVLSTLSATLVVAATDASRTTLQEEQRAKALAAAQAGMQAAVYRLSAQQYNGSGSSSTILNLCFKTEFVSQPSSGNCEGQPESLGSRGSYTYYVSPDMGESTSCGSGGGAAPCWKEHTTKSCTGYPVESTSAGLDLSQRCVTSIGEYQGTKIRVQERVVDYAFTFPVSGLLSLSNITFDTNKPSEGFDGCPEKEGTKSKKPPACPPVYLNGQFEANGAIKIEGAKYTATKKEQDLVNGSIAIGPKGSVSFVDPTYNCPAESLKYEIFSGTKVACSTPAAQSANYPWSSQAKLSDYTSSATSNEDETINTANSTASPKPYISSSRTFVVTSTNSSAAKPIVIPDGVYNFCSFEVNKGYVEVPLNANVLIYIDNSTTEDGCSKSNTIDGQLRMPSAGFLNQNSNPQTLMINVCGKVTGSSGACGEWSGTGPETKGIGLVTLNDDLNSTGGPEGNGMTYGEIYAPDSAYTTTGLGLRWTGGLVAGTWESNDNDWIQGAPGYSNNPTLAFYPVAYHRCSTATSTDPTSGCY